MNATHHFRPCLEQLDDRTLPSVSVGGSLFPAALGTLDHSVHVIRAPLVQPAQAQQQALFGLAFGTWTTKPTLPDAGTIQVLEGSGFALSLGRVQISGTLHTPGLVLQGRTTGTLILSNAQGSITLQLVGPPQPGFSPPPSELQYTITGATGAYAGATGAGTVILFEVSGQDQAFLMIFTPASGQIPPPPNGG